MAGWASLAGQVHPGVPAEAQAMNQHGLDFLASPKPPADTRLVVSEFGATQSAAGLLPGLGSGGSRCGQEGVRITTASRLAVFAAARPSPRLADRLLRSTLRPPPSSPWWSPSSVLEPQHPTPRGPCIPGAQCSEVTIRSLGSASPGSTSLETSS